jgi:hypothetical protein
MDFPIRCQSCGREVWVDLESPTIYFEGIYHIEVYQCDACGTEMDFFVCTSSLDDAMHKLSKMNPAKSQFKRMFYKTLKKAMGVREKYG